MAKRQADAGRRMINLRRMYVDCRYGQLHVRSAFASNGGFDELTPLLCLHGLASSGHMFTSLLELMGGDRSIYAPDAPGAGESDPAPGMDGTASFVDAAGDFLDALRIRRVDLVGCGEGARVAVELALARPERVQRLVLVAMPAGRTAEQASRLRQPMLVLGQPGGAPPEALDAVAGQISSFLD